MYYATVFCLLVMAFRIPSNPASCMAYFRGGYVHSPSPPIRGCFLVIRHSAPYRKLSRARSIRGVSTHVYSPNSSTACITALKTLPDTLLSTPSRLKIRNRLPQIFRAFTRLPATASQ